MGVYTKCDKELFKFWKNFISVVYRKAGKAKPAAAFESFGN